MKNVLPILLGLISLILVSCEDNKPTFTRAAIMSEDFVTARMRFPVEVEYDGDRRGSETGTNEYSVYQKFTSKNTYGVKVSYFIRYT